MNGLLWKIHQAAREKNEAQVDLLMKSDEPLGSYPSPDHGDLLYFAILNKYLPLAHWLIEKGVVGFLDREATLEYVFLSLCADDCDLTIKIGERLLPLTQKEANYFLMHACLENLTKQEDFQRLFRWAIKQGADPNMRTPDGMTLIHMLCMEEEHSHLILAVDSLIHEGADLLAEDDDGETALTASRSYTCELAVDYVRAKIEQQKLEQETCAAVGSGRGTRL